MFKSKFSKLCTLLLVFAILFSTCSMSYAEGPIIGKPNSIQEIYNEDGSLKQRRQFGEDGRAKKDIDYSHGGVGHEFPHVHDWKWKDGKSKRDDPRKPKEGEIKEVEEKAKKEKEAEEREKKVKETKEQAKDVAKGVTVGAALGTALYFIISEGSRIVFPPRNLIPIL